MAKILAFSASNHSQSINRQLLEHAISCAPALSITQVDINDYPLPMHSIDLEAQPDPENATKFKQLLSEYDAYIIACPEYNGSMPAVFKNLLDWLSRIGDKSQKMFGDNKPILLLSASPGPTGGSTNLANLAKLLPFQGGNVITTFSAGGFSGELDAKHQQELQQAIDTFAKAL